MTDHPHQTTSIQLLSTDRAELRTFASPEDVVGGYAILSHTWDTEVKEQTYQEIVAIGDECYISGDNPRDFVSEKIRQACLVAQEHGLDWIWIDSCCINKANSAELSEAISSMFRWYASAEVCIAYLADVPGDDEPGSPDSAFRKARWHNRGWTLQEGIAPFEVYFYAKDWSLLGTKHDLHEVLEEISGIPSAVLRHTAHYSTFSVAQRMSWAAGRQLTRPEDVAYSLMGLLNVTMPTIYGEGSRAFHRLQQEIMKQTGDASLFAWGPLLDATVVDFDAAVANIRDRVVDDSAYLLATSPKDFRLFNNAVFTPDLTVPIDPYLPGQFVSHPKDAEVPVNGPFGERAIPRFSMTTEGVKFRFPVIRIQDATIAVLLCESNGQHLGLLLHESPDAGEDPTRPRFRVGWPCVGAERGWARLVTLGNNLNDLHVGTRWTALQVNWETLFVVDRMPALKRAQLRPSATIHEVLHQPVYPFPFFFSSWILHRLTNLGWKVVARPISGNEDSPFPVALEFEHWEHTDRRFHVIVGTCFQGVVTPAGAPINQAGFSARWAKVYFDGDEAGASPTIHDCATDHITPARLSFRTAGDDAVRVVEVSFQGRGPAVNPALLPPRIVLEVKMGGTDLVDLVDDVLRTA
ncbi:HET-domain-containing protein [Epithele typhae]|uniref:HET-domain-containing protein n=1 Tax=Epithele typhae TaxID=378194 RepID=UPI00200804AF|nr:HET-domain-containing protein [Epithele typhae]KAH9937837.1 HET-domain-containing protein [Epithele typhae]